MGPEDAMDVARLFARSFRPDRVVDLELVARRLVRVYLEHPWAADRELRPWVYEASAGRVVGFLGVIPRALRWRGRRLRAAVIGNLMADQEHVDAGASHRLISAFLEGSQDLALNDSALDVTRKISSRFGGHTLRLLSQSWRIELQPLLVGAERWLGRPPVAARAFAGLARLADRAGHRLGRGPWRIYRNGCSTRPLSCEALAEWIARLGDDCITPEYDARGLAWLIDTPRGCEAGLRAYEVMNPRGDALGWFLYYVDVDAEVLQIGALPGAGLRVIECLVDDAAAVGARSLGGRLVPTLMLELSSRGARFFTHDWTILHTRDPEIAAAFQAGEAFFSPLDGERWSMRFIDVEDRRSPTPG